MSQAPIQTLTSPYTLPLFDDWIKFTSTTVGRDKMYRLIQYSTKWLAYSLEQQQQQQTADGKDHIVRLQRLSSAVGMARKLFRLGKPIDFLQTILKSVSLKDDVIRICAIGRSAFLAGWLTLDSIQWFHAQKVIQVADIKWFNTNAARCWFMGLLFAVAADGYRLRNNFQRMQLLEKSAGKKFDDEPETTVQKELQSLKVEQGKILTELFQDSLDTVIPMSLLGWISVSSGFVGAVGTITSVIGCKNAWPKS